MGFVKTREEVARLEKVLSHPRFVGAEMLTIDYLTTPEIVRSILPPGLEPAAEPLITAMVGRWRSNCVADFAGGAIYVAARHKDIEAAYVLAMFMDTAAFDVAVEGSAIVPQIAGGAFLRLAKEVAPEHDRLLGVHKHREHVAASMSL